MTIHEDYREYAEWRERYYDGFEIRPKRNTRCQCVDRADCGYPCVGVAQCPYAEQPEQEEG